MTTIFHKTDLTLSIEAAVNGGSLSLFRNDREVDRWTGGDGPARAESLLPNIAKLLAANGNSCADITLIVVSAGPGSFTGIRIGVATALGLGAANGAEIKRLSLLAAMAAGEMGVITSVLPVGRGMYCTQSFDVTAAAVNALSEPLPVPEIDLTTTLAASASTRVVSSSNILTELDLTIVDNLASCLANAAGDPRVNADMEPLFVSKAS